MNNKAYLGKTSIKFNINDPAHNVRNGLCRLQKVLL
jgi:hypothetical protein